MLLMFIGQCWSQTSNVKKDSIEIQTLEYFRNTKKKDRVFDNWDPPSEKELIFLIKELDTVSPQDWNYCFGTIDIGAKGVVCIDNIKYKYNLDGGGWISISPYESKGETIYLANKGDKYLNYFAIESHCDENLESKF